MIKSLTIFCLICIANVSLGQEDTLKEFVKSVSIQEASSSFSKQTINASPIQHLKGNEIGSLLQQLTPSFIKTYGMGGIATLSIRGGGANHTQVFWNGIAINSPTLGQTDLSLLPTEFVDVVSLNAGATASFDGNGGIGGSLGLNSDFSFKAKKEIVLKKEWGSFGADNSVLHFATGSNNFYNKTSVVRQLANNNFEYRDYAQQGKPLVERQNASTQLIGFQESMAFRKGKSIFEVKLNYVEANREIPVAIGVNKQEQTQIDKSFKSVLVWNFNHLKKLKIDHQVKGGFVKDYLNFSNKTTGINSTFETEVLSVQYHTKWHLKNNWNLRTQLIGYQFFANSDGFDGQRLQNRTSGYLDLNKEWDKFNFLVSIREELIDFDKFNLIPTVGGDWHFYREQKLFVNAGQNFHQPTLNDLYWRTAGNEQLLPEMATQGEIGLKGSISNYKTYYTLSYFKSQVNNWIQWIPSEDGIWRPQNIKNVSKQGINGKLTYVLSWNYKFSLIAVLNYQYLDVKSIESHVPNDESVGKDLIYSPRHLGNIDFTFYTKNFTVRYTQNWSSKLYLDAVNTTYLPYIAPASLELKYKFSESSNLKNSVELKLGIFNLYNEEYQTVANQPLPGRYFNFGFVVNLGK